MDNKTKFAAGMAELYINVGAESTEIRAKMPTYSLPRVVRDFFTQLRQALSNLPFGHTADGTGIVDAKSGFDYSAALSPYIGDEGLRSSFAKRLASCTCARQYGKVLADMAADTRTKLDATMTVTRELILALVPEAAVNVQGFSVGHVRKYVHSFQDGK